MAALPNALYNATPLTGSSASVFVSSTTVWINWIGMEGTGGTITVAENLNGLTWQAWQVGCNETPIATGTVSALQATTALNVWSVWNSQLVRFYGSSNSVIRAEVQESEECKRVRDEQLRKFQEEEKLKTEKAKKLLFSMLTDEQKESWEKKKHFEVLVKGKLYRIRKSSTVRLLDDEKKEKISYCIHPSYDYRLPEDDVALAQKLLLETDEEAFLRIANATRLAS